MQTSVRIDDKRLLRATERTSRAFQQTHRMLDIVARTFRDHVRRTIVSQDGGKWAGPSKWTRAKKRTTRALSGQQRNITHIFASRTKAMVVYQGSSLTTGRPISITEHHFGRTLPADGRLHKIAIKNPAPLKLGRNTTSMWFRWLRPSVVPARKIWPDAPGEAKLIAEPVVSRWVAQTVGRTWK